VSRNGGSVQSTVEGYGDRIKSQRLSVGISQLELAERVGVSRQTVIAMESGSYAPSVFLALMVANELGTTVEFLWGNS
jgi:putative transcriptional regulator